MAATPRIFYTDGSASPNPGPGGYAVIEQGKPVALGSEPGNTTNIRMEGMALIAAMQLAGAEECEIHTDSEFWVNALTKWLGSQGLAQEQRAHQESRARARSLCALYHCSAEAHLGTRSQRP